MMIRCRLKKLVAAAAVIPLIVPSWTCAVLGSEPASAAVTSADTPSWRPTDVRLLAGNVLQGRIVDSDGFGLPNQEVLVSQGNRLIARGQTSAVGEFSMALPRGGVYLVSAAERYRLVRAWTGSAAPKNSPDMLELGPTETFVRAQNGGNSRPWYAGNGPLGLSFWGVAAIAGTATAIAVPVAIHERNDKNNPVHHTSAPADQSQSP